MNKYPIAMMFIFILILPLGVTANTPATCKVNFDPNASSYFASSIEKAKEAMDSLCVSIKGEGLSENEVYATLLSFHLALQQDAIIAMPSLSAYLDIYLLPLINVTDDVVTGMMPNLVVDKADVFTVNDITLFKQGRGGRIDAKIPKASAQECFDDDTCWTAFNIYIDILKQVYNPLRLEPINITLAFITAKDKEWSTYIKQSRTQTPLGISLTSLLYEVTYGKEEHDFKSPPKVQWFALRPNLLFENVSGALDGDQVRGTTALEVIGFNYWQDQCFGYACGASITVNYADRNGVKDIGYGFMVHFDNTFSFGVSKYGGEAGFFVTVDLLELFIDKKQSFNEYREKYRKLGR